MTLVDVLDFSRFLAHVVLKWKIWSSLERLFQEQECCFHENQKKTGFNAVMLTNTYTYYHDVPN
jgi:hypothetical protein